MNREIVSFETAISQIVEQLGYSPQLALDGSKTPFYDQLPAAVIYNSTLIDKIGREQCRLTTEVQVLMIKSGVSCSEEAKLDIMAQMKCDALDVISALSLYENVVDVTEIEVEMDGDFMAHSDNVGVCIEATVVSNYNALSEELQVM